MIENLTKSCLKFRFFLTIILFLIIGYGAYLYNKMPVDAFPDISPIMVPIFTEADGMAPEEVERLITWPIESTMNGLPDIERVKSTSAFGMSVVYVYFKDSVDIYFARQLVSQRLGTVSSKLSFLHEPPVLGPISTGLGQIMIYYLVMDKEIDTKGLTPLMYLRDLNDWVIKYQLQTIPGVTDVLSMGGEVPQFHITLNPTKMQRYDITLDDIVDAVNKNNKNVGGQYLVSGSEEYLIRGISFIKSLKELKNIHLKLIGEKPVLLKDVAIINWGAEVRRGVVTRNGGNEVVSGIVMKLYGENTSNTIKFLYEKIKDIQKTLPDGVKIIPYYEQAKLVNSAANTIKTALLEGIILVVIILLLCLWSLRAAFIVALSIPFCASVAFIGMYYMGISANLMSLGGIAIALGTLVDGSIVTVENILKNRHKSNSVSSLQKNIINSSKETGRPIFFSLIIIIAVLLPVLGMEGVEKKMFTPMAYTIMIALLGALVFAIVFAPVLCSFLFSDTSYSTGTNHKFWGLLENSLYKPVLLFALKIKYLLFFLAFIASIIAVFGLVKIGKEFMPALEENSILITVTMPPSISLNKAIETVKNFENRIIEYKEVKEVVSRVGRPEAGSHPHPINYAEIQIDLKKNNVKLKKMLIAKLRDDFKDYPGVNINFSQPIQNAFDELISGIKSQVAIKIYGDNLKELESIGSEIAEVLHNVNGLVDISSERSLGQPQLQVSVKREALKQFGVPASLVIETVEKAIGGEIIDYAYLNIRRYAIKVRLDKNFRSEIEKLKELLIPISNNRKVKLSQLANLIITEGPVQINRQNNHRVWTVQCNIQNAALGDVIKKIKLLINEKIKLPTGYFVEYGGQFENQQRAMKKLLFIIPLVVGIIFILLWSAFKSLILTLLVMINIPLSLIGGILGLYITGEYLSVPAAIGFIALFGIAMQDAVVMISYFKESSCGSRFCSLTDLVISKSLARLRPVLMTTATTLLGLLPLVISTGTGSEVQRPLAVVVIYGLISSTLLTLIFIPILYATVNNIVKYK